MSMCEKRQRVPIYLRLSTKSTTRKWQVGGSGGNYGPRLKQASNDGQITGASFPQLKEDCSGKRAIDIPDAQQRAAVPDWLKPDVVCGGRSRIANALHFVFDRPSARFLCAICRGAGR